MEKIIGVNDTTSAPFKIPAGKQLTIFASGLGAGEYVEILLATITPGNPGGGICCPGPVELPGLGQLYPLNRVCCDCEATPVQLTRENPWYVLREPQEVDLIAHVVAGSDAVVEVYSSVTENNGSCEQAPCPECPPVTISVTSFTQTTATVAITGGPAVVTLNGVEQYGNGPFTFGNLEPGKQYVASVISDCGSKATTALTTEPPPPCPEVTVTVTAVTQTSVSVSITGGPALVTVGNDQLYGNGPFTFAGLTPSKFYTVMAVNDCGKRGSAVAETLAAGYFCASIASPWPSRGFLYHPNDARDPAATVNVVYEGVSYGFGYPNPGPGHTSAVLDKEGVVLAYAANTSDCAPPCPCEPVDICAEIAKCPQPSVVFNNAGKGYGGGLCSSIWGSGQVDPPDVWSIYQARDTRVIQGPGYGDHSYGPTTGIATFVTMLIENPFDVEALVKVELIGQANIDRPQPNPYGFIFAITEEINADVPRYVGIAGGPINESVVFCQVDNRPSTMPWPDAYGDGESVPLLTGNSSGTAVKTLVLPPRGTKTLYGQFWVAFKSHNTGATGVQPAGPNPPQVPDRATLPFIGNVHGGMYMGYTLFRSGIQL